VPPADSLEPRSDFVQPAVRSRPTTNGHLQTLGSRNEPSRSLAPNVSMPTRASDQLRRDPQETAKPPIPRGPWVDLLWRSNRLFVGNKPLFCRIKTLFWRLTGNASFGRTREWRKTPALWWCGDAHGCWKPCSRRHMKVFPCSSCLSREVDRPSHLRRLAQAS
jgi:hypothetical protein